ncbi:MAG: 50S ribosomal protein L11 methyltransferase [Gammaproteobacteria bacterium]
MISAPKSGDKRTLLGVGASDAVLALPLIELAPRLAGLGRPGSYLALSGILRAQTAACLAAYRPWFNMEPTRYDGEWALLSGVRTQTPTTQS